MTGATCIPEQPNWTTGSERQVWETIRAKAPPDWTIIANQVLSTAEREHEIDLLVLMPDVGVVVIEVKGGSIWVDQGGVWRQSSHRDEKAITPVDQVMGNKYAARSYVEHDPRWQGRHRVRWGHTVVFPHSVFDEDFSMPDCARYAVQDRNDQADLVGRLYDIAAAQEGGHRAPTADDCDLIAQILQGRSLPLRDVVAIAAERADQVERLTNEQALILSVTRLIHRAEVRGGAGSGKTVLAATQAKSLARQGKRVAVLCYSIGLASFFKRHFRAATHRQRPAFFGTYEDFARDVLGITDFGDRLALDFWETELPRQMSERVAPLPPGKRFDAFIVDEAQDFADDWWLPLLGALRDEQDGGLYVYSDENQRVFNRFGHPPVALVPLILDQNLRNTRQIAESFAPLTPTKMSARGGDGPEVTFVAASKADAVDVADAQLEGLFDEGWEAEHCALITTGARHPQQVAYQEELGQDGYWDTFWDSSLEFYGHVLGCKGLERKAVVLCINEGGHRDRFRERLYVGLSRATDRLVVVGDPGLIREQAPDVAKRLGIV